MIPTQIVNLTPHALDLPGVQIPKPAPGTPIPRVEEDAGRVVANVGGVEIRSEIKWGAVVGLPSLEEMSPSTGYVVSSLVAGALRQAGDPRLAYCLVVGPPIRDEAGRTVGTQCLRLASDK